MDNAPDYVQGYWREHGFNLSHKCAISFKVLDQFLALLANGSGQSGFHKALLEDYKIYHFHRVKCGVDTQKHAINSKV